VDRPRLAVLTEYFHPEEAATARLLTDLAVGLTDGFDVEVLTGRPSYHPADRDRSVPRESVHEGVRVRRVRSTRFDKDRLGLRVCNWLTFLLAVTVRLLRGSRDVTLVVSNPPLLPFAAWVEHRLRGTPYVYLVHDLYPEFPVALGLLDPEGSLARLWGRAARLLYRDADRVIVLGESMRERVLARMADDPGFDPSSVVVVHNWEDPTFVEPKPKAESDVAHERGTVEPFTLVYSGNLGRFHDLETAVDAIGRLEREGRSVRFLVVGEGARKADLERYVADAGIGSVEFLPFQPAARVPETLTAGDATLVGVRPEVAGACVSSKLYSSLAAGRPVLAVTGADDEVRRIVESCDAGAWVEPGDDERAAAVLRSWMDDPEEASRLGTNARCCLEGRFTRDRAVTAYRDVLRSVTDGREDPDGP
jgi:glycosyltransferase involved in cell wall biosynthesis